MKFAELLQKALNEREFASLIITDPEAALKEIGVTPTPEKIQALKEASYALLSAKSAFGDISIDNL